MTRCLASSFSRPCSTSPRSGSSGTPFPASAASTFATPSTRSNHQGEARVAHDSLSAKYHSQTPPCHLCWSKAWTEPIARFHAAQQREIPHQRRGGFALKTASFDQERGGGGVKGKYPAHQPREVRDTRSRPLHHQTDACNTKGSPPGFEPCAAAAQPALCRLPLTAPSGDEA